MDPTGRDNEGFEMSEPNGIISNMYPEEPSISNQVINNYTATNGKPPTNQNLLKRNSERFSVSVPDKNAKRKEVDPDEEEELKFEDLEFEPNNMNLIARIIDGVRRAIYTLVVKNKKVAKYLALGLIFVLYNAYFITSIVYNRRHKIEWAWCDGHGLLIILTGLTYLGLVYYQIIIPFYGRKIYMNAIKPTVKTGNNIFSRWYMQVGASVVIIGGVIAFIVIDAWDTPKRMVSALGVVVMLALGLLLSRFPGRVQWSQVLGGLAIQFFLGLLVLRWEGGRDFLECVSNKISRFLRFADDGSSFIYGYLSSGTLSIKESSYVGITNHTLGFEPLFAFQALSVVYFFSFFVGMLFHLGIMTWVVVKVGWLLQISLGTTAAESMNASANIFLGQTEAPLLIRPYLGKMTRSEIHAVMTGGFATIAGSVMAAYIGFGISASSLLTASVMAAPAALAMSKLIYPETQKSKTFATDIQAVKTKSDGNALDAAAQGAAQGFILIGNIIANLIAVISFVAFLNAVISWFGVLVGQEQLSFEWILGKIFIPFAICLGVDSENVNDVALLLGLKTVVNEFVAYERLLKMDLTPRSRRIAEYALCSFANFSSVGIQLGGLSTLAPSRRLDFSAVVWSALMAGTLASLLNACVAGALIEL